MINATRLPNSVFSTTCVAHSKVCSVELRNNALSASTFSSKSASGSFGVIACGTTASS